MEENDECLPVTVEGDWSPAQTKTAKNKLELYFNSKKKSRGGDCRVEVEDEAPRAAVYFRTKEVKERVCARQNHEIILDGKTVKLRLSSEPCSTNSADVSDSSIDSKTPSTDQETPKSEVEPEAGASAKETDDPIQSLSVVLDNVVDATPRDLLQMLVENVSGVDDSFFDLEIILESSKAVVTFKRPADVEKFLTVSQSNQKLQKYKLTAWQLEAAKSIRVENLSPRVVEGMLDMYFEKNWVQPESIDVIPEEEAAIVTFMDPKVVESICIKHDHSIGSTPVKVYPYFKSLGTALYGKERPAWKMPEAFIESVLSVVWKFLEMKKLFETINKQMRPYHCSVNMDRLEAKLSPVPNYLRQKGLTAQQVDTWQSTARDAFRRLLSQYVAFECPASRPAWKAAEKEVQSVVREDAVLILDESRGVLTVAAHADNMKRIRAPVENIILEAMDQIERQTNDSSIDSKTPSTDQETPKSEVEPEAGASAKETDDPIQSLSVVLDNIVDATPRDLLQMLVENVSGVDDSFFDLEIILESSKAVVTFKRPADVEKFLTVSQSNQKLQKYKLTAWQLEAAKSIRVENLSPRVVEGMLDMYFEKNWVQPESIDVIPEEEAAIVTFMDPKVVESICIKHDHSIGSTPVKVYPYFKSLGTALYGKERPAWKMPEAFIESVLSVVWKFLEMKKLFETINKQMRPYHCSVNMDRLEAKLSPVPNYLRQKGLTAQQVDTWQSTARDAFRQLLSQYVAFECPASRPAWKAAEKEVQSVVREDAVLILDESRGVLTVAAHADNMKRIRAPVENIILEAMDQIERQTNDSSIDSKTPSTDQETPKSEVEPEAGASAKETDDPIQSLSVVLDNVVDATPRDLLQMLVENVSGVDDSFFDLEIILESSKAVVTFKRPADAEKFLTVSQSSQKLQKYELTAWQLEAAKSIRVENLSPRVVEGMLDMYFEKNWVQPESIDVIPEEEAAIVTFRDPKVVESICIKHDHSIGSTPVKVYPYFKSLGTALYGKERPAWKMPEAFTESVLSVVWKFLEMKKLFDTINKQMHLYHCSVNMERPEAKLSPVPNYLRQKGLTAQQVDTWQSTARDAFRQLLSQYVAFECPASRPAWKAAEKEVRSVVREDAVLILDESRGVLTVATHTDNMKRIRAPVENVILEAMDQIERQTNGISESLNIPPAMYKILQQDGLQKAAGDISPDMKLSYNKNTQKLSIEGLVAEVNKMKSWILERNMSMSKKQIDILPSLVEFLKTVDPMTMSQHLFTSQGISAIFRVDNKEVFLQGISDSALARAENKIKEVLSTETLDVEDQEVLKLPGLTSLKQQLLESFNSSKGNTVSIQIHPGRRDKVVVAGFTTPVKEVSCSLMQFISNYSQIQDSVPLKSCAVVQFIEKRKSQECISIVKDHEVDVNFDLLRKRIRITGARLHVQNAKSCFREIAESLFIDNLSVNKPGAKKYFQSQGSLFLSKIMAEFCCVVILRPENDEEEEVEEEENYEEEDGISYCKVKTASGVLVSVRKANICSFGVDAVVNAANEDLQHIEGLALELLKAAGPELQKISDDYVNGEFSDLKPTMTMPSQTGPSRPQASGRYQRGGGRGGNKGNSPRGRHSSESGRGGQYGGGRGAGGHSRGGRGADRGAQSLRGHMRHGGHEGSGKLEQTTAEGLKIVLWKGNIQDQTTNVIVNTIADSMNLQQGVVSNAILKAAGPGLQRAVKSEAGVAATLQFGDVVITDGFNLMCRKVFHVVCPVWDNGGGQAEEMLITIIRQCLVNAENLKMASLSFPAIGTGNLGFPRDVVSRVLLSEIHSFSGRKTPHHLREVTIVVHPSDSQTVDRFARDFKGQTSQRSFQPEAWEFVDSASVQSPPQPQQKSAFFGQVSSTSLGVYQMQMGTITLEVSSGDITKERWDAIINSSNQTFNLQSGVSKAILDSAGMRVQMECTQIVQSPGYQSRPWILTSAGHLPSRNIIHVVGQNDPMKIKEIVYSVLKVCEENRFRSVAFPALGTGVGGASPSLVADAMVEAVVDFVRKKHPKSVRSVKILIFQTSMVMEFHKSMKKREGEELEEKSIFTKLKDAVSGTFSSLFSGHSEGSSRNNLVLETEDFGLTEFQLCADNEMSLNLAKKRIEELIVAEQAKKTISDFYICKLSQEDLNQLRELQRNLTVSIRLERGQEDEESKIHLEGLTRDVYAAESSVRDIIRRVEREEALKNRALLVSSLVEWQFQHPNGSMVTFDILTNLKLEEALEKKENVKIKINNQTYSAEPKFKKAVSSTGKMVELLRKDLKAGAPLPQHWDDMKGDLLKLIPLTAGSQEYNEVETELTKTGLTPNILSIDRVQNPTLWQSYQIKKAQLEKKNGHKNNEKCLYHGTPADSIDKINTHGFNRSYAGKHAAMYGNGAYFAVDPCYSARGYARPDSKGHKRMYQARVLVGDYAPGRNGLLAPPSKPSGSSSDLYDSVTDNNVPPTIFVVFNDMLAYPEYLITFT